MRIITVLVALLSTVAAAQAPANTVPVDPNLILDLLGTGHAVEIELPPDVEQVLLYGIRDGEVLLRQDKRVTPEEWASRGGRIHAEVSAGGLNGVGSCAVLGFASLALLEATGFGFSVGTSSRCLHDDESHQIRGGSQPIPLKLHPGPHDLPLDTWLPLEAVWVWSDGQPVGSQENLADFLVYYLYLRTSNSERPELPTYSNWGELRAAYQPNDHD